MVEKLVVVCGNACTGKSHWARLLASHLRAAVLDIDTVSERLVEAAQKELGRDPKDRDSSDYKRVFREAIHETLFSIARESFSNVVLVAPFTRERNELFFPTLVEEKTGRSPEIHYFITNEEIRRQRILERKNPRDLGKFADYEAYRALGARDEAPPYPHLWFDTTTSFPNLGDYEMAIENLATRQENTGESARSLSLSSNKCS